MELHGSFSELLFSFCNAGSGTQGFTPARPVGVLGPCVFFPAQAAGAEGVGGGALEADPPPCWAENNPTLASHMWVGPRRGGPDDISV